MSPERLDVRLEHWGGEGLQLLERLNTPDMTRHVGGPESAQKLIDRQARYERPDSRQYMIVEPAGERIGWVGYWERAWRDQEVWETGWAVVPAYQGRGVASSATRQLLEIARAERLHRFVHAYPMTVNAPSNAICRMLGFELLGEIDFPGRRGGVIRCNDWRFDLFDDEPAGTSSFTGVFATSGDLSHHGGTGERRWSYLHKQQETPEVTGC